MYEAREREKQWGVQIVYASYPPNWRHATLTPVTQAIARTLFASIDWLSCRGIPCCLNTWIIELTYLLGAPSLLSRIRKSEVKRRQLQCRQT